MKTWIVLVTLIAAHAAANGREKSDPIDAAIHAAALPVQADLKRCVKGWSFFKTQRTRFQELVENSLSDKPILTLEIGNSG